MATKRLYNLVALLSVAAAVLAACGPAPTPAAIVKTQAVETPVAETVTLPPPRRQLEVFHWLTAPGEREAAAAMFAALYTAHPDIEVVESPVEGDDGTELRVVLKARKQAGILPDTFTTLGGAELRDYVANGILEPLDDFYAASGYASKLPQPLLKAITVDGHPYSVPLNVQLENVLYFNKRLFDELKLSAPSGYDDLIATCEAIQAAKPDMVCLEVGSQDTWADVFVLDTIMLELGGPEYYVKFFKGEVDVSNDPVFAQSLEKLVALRPYVNMKDHSRLTWDLAVSAVGGQRAAMTIMGTWAIGTFIKVSSWQPGVDLGVVSYPTRPERILLFHPDSYGCTAGAPHPAECRDWLSVITSPELQIPTEVIQGGLFARTDIHPQEFPDPIHQEMQAFANSHPDKLILDQFASILPNDAQAKYREIISTFFASEQPDVHSTAVAVANMMTAFKVKEAAAWYQWP